MLGGQLLLQWTRAAEFSEHGIWLFFLLCWFSWLCVLNEEVFLDNGTWLQNEAKLPMKSSTVTHLCAPCTETTRMRQGQNWRQQTGDMAPCRWWRLCPWVYEQIWKTIQKPNATSKATLLEQLFVSCTNLALWSLTLRFPDFLYLRNVFLYLRNVPASSYFSYHRWHLLLVSRKHPMQIAACSPTPTNLFSELLHNMGCSVLQNFLLVHTRTLLSLESWPDLSLPLRNPLKFQI